MSADAVAAREVLVQGVERHGRRLSITWSDGARAAIHGQWLRDICPCDLCLHAGTGQRLLDSASIPAAIDFLEFGISEQNTLWIRWSGDGHLSRYDLAGLRVLTPATNTGLHATAEFLWDASMERSVAAADYREVSSNPEKLRDWLATVDQYGFALLHAVGSRPGEVMRVVELFGFVRETNYGRLFDVRSEFNPNNLANTSLALGPHTDNPYRDPTPSLQLLHCLTSSARGGQSTLVDGFRVAEELRRDDETQFDLLCRQPVRFRFQDAATDLVAEWPIIGLNSRGQVNAIHFNNRSRCALVVPDDLIEQYYAAYQRFARLLEDERYQIRVDLAGGDLMIMDNLRVLHGRTGFSASGSRHLQGCYADRDGLRSRLAVLLRAHSPTSP